MKVEYKGHKILRGLDGVDMRHLRPAAIITGKHEEKQLIDKVIAKSGYVGCVFDDDDGVHGMPDATIESCEVTDDRMYIKVVNPRIQAEVVPGDIVQSGMLISNSEVGLGGVVVQPLIYRLVCTNGMVVNAAGEKRRHIGRIQNFSENRELFRDETLKADDRAFMMKLRDIVSATVDQTQFDKVLDIMRQAKQVPITGTDVPKVVELTGKHIGFGEKEGAGILSHLIAGGDLSLYGLSNAVTRFSQDVKSYDRATELEAAGYDVLTLSPAIWKSINEQAAVTV